MINTANKLGNTILHMVSGDDEDQGDLSKFLLKYGANPMILNNKGDSALDLAEVISDSIWIASTIPYFVNT